MGEDPQMSLQRSYIEENEQKMSSMCVCVRVDWHFLKKKEQNDVTNIFLKKLQVYREVVNVVPLTDVSEFILIAWCIRMSARKTVLLNPYYLNLRFQNTLKCYMN